MDFVGYYRQDAGSNAWQTPDLLVQLEAGARQFFESLYTEDINYACLMDLYQAAIKRNVALRTL